MAVGAGEVARQADVDLQGGGGACAAEDAAVEVRTRRRGEGGDAVFGEGAAFGNARGGARVLGACKGRAEGESTVFSRRWIRTGERTPMQRAWGGQERHREGARSKSNLG